MYVENPEAFEEKLAHLPAKTERFWKRFWDAVLHCFWWCCCCFWFASDPYKRDSNTWSVTNVDDHVARPAHLKISTSDKRAVEIKIVYAVNPAVASQLYEVDVFMFFLQDLEAVSNNFYHDLWQVVRLHTPKVPLSAVANDPSAGFIGLIEQELLAIQSKQAAGDAAAVQQEVDKIVQQLRLHVCIYRNSVRRALKGIANALEDLEGSQAGAAETGQVCQAVITVVRQIAQSLHQLQLACTPCQSPDAPETIRAVWRLVDEYALAESERATLKLLKGLDKHLLLLQHSAPAAAPAPTPIPTPAPAPATLLAGALTAAAATSMANQQAVPQTTHQGHGHLAAFAVLADNRGAVAIQEGVQTPGLAVSHQHPAVMGDRQPAAPQPPERHRQQAQQNKPGNSMHQHAAWQGSSGAPQTGATSATLPGDAYLSPQQGSQQHSQEGVLLPHRRAATADQPQGSSQLPPSRDLLGPSLIRASGNSYREKLEYRLSQDDAPAPSLAELAGLMKKTGQAPARWSADISSRRRLHSHTGFLTNLGQPANGLHPQMQPLQGRLFEGHMQADHFANPLVLPNNGNGQWPQQQQQQSTQGLLEGQIQAPQEPRVHQSQQHLQVSEGQQLNGQLQQPLPEQLHQGSDQGQLQQPQGQQWNQPQGQQWHQPEEEQLQQASVQSEPPSRMLSLMQNASAVQAEAEGLAEGCKGLEEGQEQVLGKLKALQAARQLVVDAVVQLQEARRQQGYLESILLPTDPARNEAYTNCIKCLKHNARAAVVLKPELLPQSFLLADLVGMTVAGLAMLLACGAIYVATRFSRNQLSGVYVTIIVVGYMLKDRLKEWGKRYLQPSAMKFGFEFPDRTVKMRDSRGKRVGRCKEWVKVVGDTEIDGRVLAMRHKDKGHIPPERHATKPERVLAYRKKMEVSWQQLDPRLRGVDGLDDIMRFDLQHFCRRMQPPDEPHYCLEAGPDGGLQVQKVQCARVYHINIVLRIRTSLQDVRKDKAYREKSLQIQRARIIMDQTGIKRLEATDDSVHLMGERHSASPAWKPDMHMSALHLPRMSMPHMPAFGRHSIIPKAAELNPRMSVPPTSPNTNGHVGAQDNPSAVRV